MRVVEPTLPCSCCGKPNKVYDAADMCARCQRRVAHALDRASLLDRVRQGYKRVVDAQGHFCGYMRTQRIFSDS